MSKSVILKPRLSEKAYALSEAERTYAFDIPSGATALDVRAAVSAQYAVTVESVRLAKAAPKSRRSYRNKGRSWRKSQTSAVRKAYVTLAEGAKLPLFASAEESDKKDSKEKK